MPLTKKKIAALPRSLQKAVRAHAVDKISRRSAEMGKKAVAAANRRKGEKAAATKAVNKKKIGGAKAKPVTRVATKATGDHWFAKLTKKQQQDYIKAHPRSKYAKAAKAGTIKPDTKKSSKAAKALDKVKIRELQKAHHKAEDHEQKLVGKLNTQIAKVGAYQEKHVSAKTPTAKSKAKAMLTKAKANVKSLRLQHREAKAALKDAKKAVGGHAKMRKKSKAMNRLTQSGNRNAKVAKMPKAPPTARQKRNALVNKKLRGLSIMQRARLKETKFT